MSITNLAKTGYILAIDDIPDNLFLIKLALEQEGYHVILVDNGTTALAQIEKSPPSLILLDVMMPGMDGYEVTKRIREHPNLPYIPILLITAHEHSSLIKGLDAGADEFIRKPVHIEELQARVRSLLRLKQTIDQRENFVHCLTHDLRTPLVAADRMLALIGQGVFGDVSSDLQQAVGSIINSNQNLLQMLNTLLEVHCYEVGDKTLSFTKLNLKELVEEVVNELAPLAQEKGLEMKMDLEGQTSDIQGDRLELRRVIANLIGNAIKYTDRGSISIRLYQSSSSVAIEVEDSGVGIAAEEQKNIFERFRQGTHKRSGHGLGLYLCKQIIQSHQGTIEVNSEAGKGSVFTVKLPSTVNSDRLPVVNETKVSNQ
jgi:two-component system, sensor histidine kinase and response regulator